MKIRKSATTTNADNQTRLENCPRAIYRQGMQYDIYMAGFEGIGYQTQSRTEVIENLPCKEGNGGGEEWLVVVVE